VADDGPGLARACAPTGSIEDLVRHRGGNVEDGKMDPCPVRRAHPIVGEPDPRVLLRSLPLEQDGRRLVALEDELPTVVESGLVAHEDPTPVLRGHPHVFEGEEHLVPGRPGLRLLPDPGEAR
jgi:hypothetical protein